jgi:hypothetical protein
MTRDPIPPRKALGPADDDMEDRAIMDCLDERWRTIPQIRSKVRRIRHIDEGADYVIKQQAIIAGLDRDGHDTTDAKQLLATLLETVALHIESRNRILQLLNREGSSVI